MNRFTSRARGIVLGLVLSVLPFSVVLASNYFTDVPDSRTDHDAITNVANAGLTLGDPSNSATYSPTKATTRGAMASFLNRGLGRVAYGEGDATAVLTTATTIASASLQSGGVASDNNPIPNANQASFFKADATFTVTCSAACNVDVVLTDGTDSSRTINVTLAAAGTEHAAVTWANDFAVGSTVTLDLDATAAAAGTATVAGEITALYAPFGAEGTNELTPAP